MPPAKKIKIPKPRYINREISWLAFNDRVLQEAHDPTVPLIERMRFMGIFSSNLDEFFRVRVASLSRLAALYKKEKRILGYNPQKILKQIKQIVIHQQTKFEHLYHDILIKQLEEERIFIINEKQLNVTRGNFVREHFKEIILSTLVPVMIEESKPFPFLKDKSIYLFVKLFNKNKKDKHKYALIEIPTDVHSRFLILPETNNLKYIILLDDVIRYCLEDIFSMFNYTNYEAHTIKLTRDAELDFDSDIKENILEVISKGVKQRKKGKPVRFVYDSEMPEESLQFLISKLSLVQENIIPGGKYHNFKDFIGFPNVGAPNLVYSRIHPLDINNLNREHNMLNAVLKKDYMIHLPYQNFDYVIRFLREAAIDPKVEFIKITLYRVAQDSRIMNALINAARNGKSVTVVLELKARFDEERNIYWTQKLIDEGVNVLHGIPDKKVHSKMCLIGRRDKDQLHYYANLSTGNFNEKTSSIYCDHSFFTADQRITKEVNRVFSYLEKKEVKGRYNHLLVAPHQMRKKLVALINNEIRNATAGKKASIILKLNSLVDTGLIDKLYQASVAGVKIKIIVRGICCLIPGLKGLSENIEAISIVDKFLEHSRVMVFENGGNELIFVSSGDWMARNLDLRLEVGFPIYDKDLQAELKKILELQLKDNTKARVIDFSLSNKYKVTRGNNYRAQIDIYNYLSNK
jgi:polyphosphate kinase